MDLEYLSPLSLLARRQSFPIFVREQARERDSPSVLPSAPHLPLLRFRPHCHSAAQRAFVMMDAAHGSLGGHSFLQRKVNRSCIWFPFPVVAGGDGAAVHFNVGGNEVQERWMKMCS